jgi:hypothetical protein
MTAVSPWLYNGDAALGIETRGRRFEDTSSWSRHPQAVAVGPLSPREGGN